MINSQLNRSNYTNTRTPRRPLTELKRTLTVTLDATSLPAYQVTSAIGASKRTIHRYRTNLRAYGVPYTPPIVDRGRLHSFTIELLEDLMEWLKENPTAYLLEMATYLLDAHAVQLSESTI